MDQHAAEIDALRRMTPAKKLAVLHSLIRQARDLKAAWIRTSRPDLTEEEVSILAWKSVAGERP
jgi:uncharacterized protein YqeY